MGRSVPQNGPDMRLQHREMLHPAQPGGDGKTLPKALADQNICIVFRPF